MDNDVVIFTACDQAFFPLCVDLVASLKRASPHQPRIRVLDVGMLPAQAREMAATVDAVIEPRWDLAEGSDFPRWFKAMTARPFLPKYAGGAAIVAWIDSDAWVQCWTPLETLLMASRDGRLAIVEERYGKGYAIEIPTGPMSYKRIVCDEKSVRANVRACYEHCFGPDITAAFGDLPSYNTGVFALRADSPSWATWQATLAGALANGSFHKLVEQQALTVAIRLGRIPFEAQAHEANFICGLELPWFSTNSRTFTLPGRPDRSLGIVHLTDTKRYSVMPIPHFPDGTSRPMPLVYRAARKFLEGKVGSFGQIGNLEKQTRGLAAGHYLLVRDPATPETWGKVGRNEPCPCGSGQKYKLCHGR